MRIRSLYVKIFAWFWLTLVVFVIGGLFVGWATRPADAPERVRDLWMGGMRMYSADALDRYERGGLPAVAEFQEAADERKPNVAIFEPNGAPIANVTEQDQKIAVDFLNGRTHRPLFRFLGHPPIWADRIISQSGKMYLVVVRLPHPPPPDLRVIALRVFSLLAIAGITCFLLARNLTAPLNRLRIATQQLAGGNLNARVTPGMGNRADEIGDLGREFDTMAERIAALIGAQQRLLGDISHELRSPLARLGVAAELARKKSGEAPAAEFARMEHEIARLSELIGQLLTLTQMESSAESIKKEKLNLRELLEIVADDAAFEAQAQAKSVVIEESVDATLEGSTELLRSALENVVRNAVRHAPAASAVEIRMQKADRDVIISVRDRGPGVPHADLSKIFGSFYRVEEARERASGGIGLGLSIAQRAVHLHGGTITAENVSPGLLIRITLPAA